MHAWLGQTNLTVSTSSYENNNNKIKNTKMTFLQKRNSKNCPLEKTNTQETLKYVTQLKANPTKFLTSIRSSKPDRLAGEKTTIMTCLSH